LDARLSTPFNAYVPLNRNYDDLTYGSKPTISGPHSYRMASHNNIEQEEPTIELPTTDSESDVEEYFEDADIEVDEEAMNEWLSARYDRRSRKPMKAPLTSPLNLPISDLDLEKLKVGVRSRDMDDKWDILVEDPDEDGSVSIHIIRSWLQEECYIFHIIPGSCNDDGGSAKIKSITWEGNKGGWQCGPEQAMKEAVMLARGHLDCEFENLPEYPSSMFWESSAYTRLEAE
jgi:hypothetical protein